MNSHTNPSPQLGYYEALGIITSLAMQTPLYRRWYVHDLDAFLVPALLCNQCKIYFSPEGVPNAFITWACLSDKDHERMLLDGTPPNLFENETGADLSKWTNGKHLWFMDVIAQETTIASITSDLLNTQFTSHQIAHFTRRNPDGSIRKTGFVRRSKSKVRHTFLYAPIEGA